MMQDTATGLDHAGQHDDSPTWASGGEQDQILFTAGDANVYRAMGNKSTNATDPSGLEWSWTDSSDELRAKGIPAFRLPTPQSAESCQCRERLVLRSGVAGQQLGGFGESQG